MTVTATSAIWAASTTPARMRHHNDASTPPFAGYLSTWFAPSAQSKRSVVGVKSIGAVIDWADPARSSTSVPQ
ncbi:hypothetical protein [Nocardia xishanensis]|uniref:hypothetical protein n=1 Tax=Nocardia xishanensis TaxID=238964 RepID=UPI000A780207|nr:hypothetical protein [Nocardia xishanensis]